MSLISVELVSAIDIDNDPNTLWVRTDGSDACTGQNNISYSQDNVNCAWQTVIHALATVTAGQTVRIQNLGSDYVGESASVSNSGIASNWITIQGDGLPVMRGTSGTTGITISGKQYVTVAGVKVIDYNDYPTNSGQGTGISIKGASSDIIIDGVVVGTSGDGNIVVGGNSTNVLVSNSLAYNAQMSNFRAGFGHNITFHNDASWVYNGYAAWLDTDYGFSVCGKDTYDVVLKNSISYSEKPQGGYGHAIGFTGCGITSGNAAHDVYVDNVSTMNGVMGFEFRDGSHDMTVNNSYAFNFSNSGFISLNQGEARHNIKWINSRAVCNGRVGDSIGFKIESNSDNLTLYNLTASNCYSLDGSAGFSLGSVTNIAASNLIAYNNKNGIVGNNITGFVSYANSNGIQGTGFKNGILTNNYRALSGASTTASYAMKYGNSAIDTTGSVCANCITADPLFADAANYDFHLKSQYGRWTPAGWVTDSVTSPAIGAGENGVEMGAYGNTPEASKGPTIGTNYYVATYGNNANDGLSLATAWQTPSYAAQQAQAGDTIYLVDGVWYNEYAVFANSGNSTHQITLKSYNGTPTLYSTNPVANIDIGLKIRNKSYITIEDITIRRYWNAVSVGQSNNIRILNVSVYTENVVPSGGSPSGINIADGSYDSSIENCLVDGNAWNSIGIGGRCYGCNPGVWSYNESYNITVKSCISRNNSLHGLLDFLGSTHDIYIVNNTFYSGWAGSVYSHQGFPSRIYLINNTIYDSANGIYFDSGTSNSVVEGNTIQDISASGGHCMQFRTNRTYGNDTFYSAGNIIRNNVCSGDVYYDVLSLAGDNYILENNSIQSDYGDKEYRIDGSGIIRNAIASKYKVSVGTSTPNVVVEYTDGSVFDVSSTSKPLQRPDVSNISYTSAQVVSVTVYNMTARPSSGYATVNVNKFNTTLPIGNILINITANTTDSNTVVFTAGALIAGRNYLVKKDNNNFTILQADQAGKIVFNSSDW